MVYRLIWLLLLVPPAFAQERDSLSSYSDPFAGEMVRVDGGTFLMGSDEYPDEKPIHSVHVPDFYLGAFEVTQQQWQEIMGNNPSFFDKCEKCPVESVSWDDVQQFIQKLNQQTSQSYRLPTEAEWEYAAGGGASNRTKWAGTSEETDLINFAWYVSNSGDKPSPVGQKSPSQLGLYDMSGNVWEWCQDWHHESYTGAPTDGSAWEIPASSNRVYRGGSWANELTVQHVAYRISDSPDYLSGTLGFRLAMTP